MLSTEEQPTVLTVGTQCGSGHLTVLTVLANSRIPATDSQMYTDKWRFSSAYTCASVANQIYPGSTAHNITLKMTKTPLFLMQRTVQLRTL